MENMPVTNRKALITGGCGFIGSNIAARLLRDGWKVLLLDRMASERSCANWKWLQSLGNPKMFEANVASEKDAHQIIRKIKPDAIFHLAGQVAMTTSVEAPRLDFEANVVGTLNVLESARTLGLQCPILCASSNKVYGGLKGVMLSEGRGRYEMGAFNGISESQPLDFQTPYGCSKGAADQYALDYARTYGLKTVVFRHSAIFGPRQYSTFGQGWIGWFCQQALETKKNPGREPFTISGNGKQVRDVLFVDDAVEAYMKALQRIEFCRGEAFNIGGGMANSCSILELLDYLQKLLKVKLNWRHIPERLNDQRFFVSDNSKARRDFVWEPKITWKAGIIKTLDWISSLS